MTGYNVFHPAKVAVLISFLSFCDFFSPKIQVKGLISRSTRDMSIFLFLSFISLSPMEKRDSARQKTAPSTFNALAQFILKVLCCLGKIDLVMSLHLPLAREPFASFYCLCQLISLTHGHTLGLQRQTCTLCTLYYAKLSMRMRMKMTTGMGGWVRGC